MKRVATIKKIDIKPEKDTEGFSTIKITFADDVLGYLRFKGDHGLTEGMIIEETYEEKTTKNKILYHDINKIVIIESKKPNKEGKLIIDVAVVCEMKNRASIEAMKLAMTNLYSENIGYNKVEELYRQITLSLWDSIDEISRE